MGDTGESVANSNSRDIVTNRQAGVAKMPEIQIGNLGVVVGEALTDTVDGE